MSNWWWIFHSPVAVSPIIWWNQRLPRRPWWRFPVPTSLGTNTAAPHLWWRHWRRGMRHAVSPSQHPPGSGFPTCTGKARRPSSWHKVSPTRTASTAMLTSTAASHVVAPRVLVSLPTLALGTEVIEHVWALVRKFNFLWAMPPVNINYQSNRRTKRFPLLQSLVMNLCIIHFNSTQSKVITF